MFSPERLLAIRHLKACVYWKSAVRPANVVRTYSQSETIGGKLSPDTHSRIEDSSSASRMRQLIIESKVEDAAEFVFHLHGKEPEDSLEVNSKEALSTIVKAWQHSPHQAENFLKNISNLADSPQCSVKPDREHYEIVLQGWLKFQPPSAKRAQALFDYMQTIGVEYDVQSCNIVLAAWSLVGNAEGAQALLDRVLEKRHSVNLETFSHVLDAWSRSKSPLAPQRAEAVLAEMRSQKIVPDSFCYLRVMDCWVKSGKKNIDERCEALLKEIKRLYESGEETNPLFCQSALLNVLQSHARISNAHRAEDLLLETVAEYRKGKAVAPTLPMFVSVLSTWSKSKSGRRAERAQKLLLSMETSGDIPNPDVVCYTAVLNCWAVSNKPDAAERAEALLNRMRNNHSVKPNILSYTSVLHAWSRSEDPQAPVRAELVFRRILEQGLVPDNLTYGAMIATWGHSSRDDAVDKAEEYLQRLKDVFEETKDMKFAPTVAQYTATILAWVNHVKVFPWLSSEAVSRAEALLDEMLNQDRPDLKPNSVTYAYVLKTIANARRIPDRGNRAERILRIMQRQGIKVNSYILGLVQKCRPKNQEGLKWQASADSR